MLLQWDRSFVIISSPVSVCSSSSSISTSVRNRLRQEVPRGYLVAGAPGKLTTPNGWRSCDQLLSNKPLCTMSGLARYRRLVSVFARTRSELAFGSLVPWVCESEHGVLSVVCCGLCGLSSFCSPNLRSQSACLNIRLGDDLVRFKTSSRQDLRVLRRSNLNSQLADKISTLPT